MIEINIKEPLAQQAPKDTFRISIETMEGDADGTDYIEILIPNKKLDEVELERFIVCINECLRKDSAGRGGIDSMQEVMDWYSEDNEDFFRYYEGAYKNKLYVNTPFDFHLPSDTHGNFYNSFENVTITYYNGSGIEQHVELILS